MKIYKIFFLPVFILIFFGCSSNEKQVDINVRLLASDIGVGKARLPFILSDENNNPLYDINNNITIEYCQEICEENPFKHRFCKHMLLKTILFQF